MSVQPQLNPVLERNIASMRKRRAATEQQRSAVTRVVDHISDFAGSLLFIAINLAIVAAWVIVNLGLISSIKPFDPSFVGLGTAVSTESLILSAFILISQNKSAAMERRRAELDVQIGLLAEHEITRLIHITTAISEHLGITVPKEEEVETLKAEVAPDEVLDKLESTEP